MRKTLALFVLLLAGALPRPSLAACPGVSACVYNKGCPAGSKRVLPGQDGSRRRSTPRLARGRLSVSRPGVHRINQLSRQADPPRLLGRSDRHVSQRRRLRTGGDLFVGRRQGQHPQRLHDPERPSPERWRHLHQRSFPHDPELDPEGRTEAVGNFARGGGMAVIGAQASPVINCTKFLENMADYDGGGLMSTYSANPYLRSDLFQGNRAPYGAAIGVAWSGRLDLGWTQLLANQAGVDGGGIHAGVPYGNVLVRQVWFKGNTAGSHGGGMWVPGGLAEVLNSTFDGNRAAEGGGIAAGFGSMVSVASSLFVHNTTTNPGSATLVNANAVGSNTSVVNHYNGFFGNTGPDFLSTYGDLGLLTWGRTRLSEAPAVRPRARRRSTPVSRTSSSMIPTGRATTWAPAAVRRSRSSAPCSNPIPRKGKSPGSPWASPSSISLRPPSNQHRPAASIQPGPSRPSDLQCFRTTIGG